jgi:glycosyltransferase involved in cell wall biosynthesis
MEARALPLLPSRLAVIGPLPPFRGGISEYNRLLRGALTDLGHQVDSFSFKRDYPQWLYPGNPGPDRNITGGYDANAHYCIDWLDPNSWRSTASQIAQSRPEAVVFHWWTVFWAPCFAFMMFLLRRQGLRIVMICHNLTDHDGRKLYGWASWRLMRLADAFLVHSTQHVSALQRTFGNKRILAHPIPPYHHHPAPLHSLPKRGRLELLFFGLIRPYKGLDVLLQAMAILDDPEVFLTVVGEDWGNRELGNCADLTNVECHLRYVTDAEAAEYFARADYVVLPYRSASGSAVAALALYYQKPIIASRVGGLPEVVIEGTTGKLVPPGDAAALAAVVRQSGRAEANALSAGVREYALTHDWCSLADALVSLIRE